MEAYAKLMKVIFEQSLERGEKSILIFHRKEPIQC